jgi:hypothetical protein
MESAWAVAAVTADRDPEAVATFDIWAMAPEIATGLGDCAGARINAAAGRLERQKQWRIGEMPPSLMDLRMIGWLADDFGREVLFWDVADAGSICASGLLACQAGDERLVEPGETVTLKVLREAVEDYEYLRMLRQLTGRIREEGLNSRLWRLRLANATWYRRNWDMVMNARAYNHEVERLRDHRRHLATQIVRTRKWLRQLGAEGELPGDRGEGPASHGGE